MDAHGSKERLDWLARKMWELRVWSGPVGLLTAAAVYSPDWAPLGGQPTLGQVMLLVAALFCLLVAARSIEYERVARGLAAEASDARPAARPTDPPAAADGGDKWAF